MLSCWKNKQNESFVQIEKTPQNAGFFFADRFLTFVITEDDLE
jgi:hypothetical protein